jgi:hypothetical protein
LFALARVSFTLSGRFRRESNVTISNAFLAIKLQGPGVKPGRVRLDDFLRLGQEVLRAVERVALVLQGSGDSQRAGRRPQDLRDAIALDVVEVTHGSPSAVVRFERSQQQVAIPGVDVGTAAFEKFLNGLTAITSSHEGLPAGFDTGVLLAVRDAGRIFDHGIDRVDFTLGHRAEPLRARYDRDGYNRIQARIVGPRHNQRMIEGRLVMADFKERGARVRVHPSGGEPVVCLFDESLRDEVFRSILRFVRVTGEATVDAVTNRIGSIRISNIERLEAREDEVQEVLPTGAPLSSDFWQALTFDELASAQGVQPLSDVGRLAGTWPGDVNDGFEESIRRLRQGNLKAI